MKGKHTSILEIRVQKPTSAKARRIKCRVGIGPKTAREEKSPKPRVSKVQVLIQSPRHKAGKTQHEIKCIIRKERKATS